MKNVEYGIFKKYTGCPALLSLADGYTSLQEVRDAARELIESGKLERNDIIVQEISCIQYDADDLDLEINQSALHGVEEKKQISRTPDVQINIFLVEHGYEARFLINGLEVEMQLRDFGGSYPVHITAHHAWATIANYLPRVIEPKGTWIQS